MLNSLLLLLAILIIAALAMYAFSTWKISSQQQRIQLDQQSQRIDKVNRDIIFIVRVGLEGQMPLTEAAIRLMALKLALPEPDQQALQLEAYKALAEATAHIPILDQWRQLSQELQLQYNTQREHLEELYRDEIMRQSKLFLLAHS